LQVNSLVQAEAYLAKGMQLAPESVLMRRLLTTTYMRSGQPAKALATVQPLLTQLVDAQVLRVRVRFEKKERVAWRVGFRELFPGG